MTAYTYDTHVDTKLARPVPTPGEVAALLATYRETLLSAGRAAVHSRHSLTVLHDSLDAGPQRAALKSLLHQVDVAVAARGDYDRAFERWEESL